MEYRKPMRRGLDKSKEGKAMDLPEGKTCADCVHCRRCCAMFGHIPADETCDWYPSKFKAVAMTDPLQTLRRYIYNFAAVYSNASADEAQLKLDRAADAEQLLKERAAWHQEGLL